MAPAQTPARFRILIPGYPQWTWRQPERAAALGGTYFASIVVGMFAWGSVAGAAMMVIAFLLHVASAADAIRQTAFPGFGRWVPATSASFGLGMGCYGPALAVAAAMAWPQSPSGVEHDRYAINLWAFRGAEPGPGDWVWYRSPDGGGVGLGRVVGGPKQSVEWSADGITVDGRALGWTPTTPDGPPASLGMTVPEGEILISSSTPGSGPNSSCGLRLVPRGGIIGRPWARLYPIWKRGLLL